MSSQMLPFISDENLYRHVKTVLDKYRRGLEEASENVDKNVIDPFSAVMESGYHNITILEWLQTIEKSRRSGKSLSNAMGTFHEDVIGSVKNWRRLEVGNVIDVVNDEDKIIADIKNKWNTTKGNHKPNVYDDIKDRLERQFKGYIGYYVEIVPKNPPYNVPFIPSDNKVGKQIKDAKLAGDKVRNQKLLLDYKRPVNEKIRRIDGKSFYHLVTGYENAIELLYEVLPKVISDLTNVELNYKNQALFTDLFKKAYK